MEIKPTYVTFEQARQIKEKWDFNVPCQYLYVDGNYRINFEKEGELFNNRYPSVQRPTDWCLAPEQWQVIEWLRVNQEILITPIIRLSTWIFSIVELKTWNHYSLINIDFDGDNDYLKSKGIPTVMKSPQEAYSAAFDYILKNNLVCKK